MTDFLHDRGDFGQLLGVVADAVASTPCWSRKILDHALPLGLAGTGISIRIERRDIAGFDIIHRFSEDIDIRIEPPKGSDIRVGKNHDKPAHIESRRGYYDDLAKRIQIPGIINIERDKQFDDDKMRSAGIRLFYQSRVPALAGVKDGILLELGFDDTTPNRPVTMSSWALDVARERDVPVRDNRVVNVLCYAPTYTFVEKLQTISTKYRRLHESKEFPANFLRHYYDVYCLPGMDEVLQFLKTKAYQDRKAQRFRTGDQLEIAKNPAFLLEDEVERQRFAVEYRKTQALYYQGQPSLHEVLARIQEHMPCM